MTEIYATEHNYTGRKESPKVEPYHTQGHGILLHLTPPLFWVKKLIILSDKQGEQVQQLINDSIAIANGISTDKATMAVVATALAEFKTKLDKLYHDIEVQQYSQQSLSKNSAMYEKIYAKFDGKYGDLVQAFVELAINFEKRGGELDTP